MKITKKELVQEKIDSMERDIMEMEIVKAFNLSMAESATSKSEVAKADTRIEMCNVQLSWLKEHLASLE